MTASKTKPHDKKCPAVLALYPNSKGISFAVMDSPTRIIESGMYHIRPICNKKCLERVESYLDYFQPDLVILEDVYSQASLRSERITILTKRIEAIALSKKLAVSHYTRQDIMDVFREFDASTKHQINEIIGSCFTEYKDKVPKKRSNGSPEPHRSGEFDAISLVFTHMFRIS